ncbi:MAG: hypothetical protein RLZZ223_155 [Candidatus Parcubacteria bacterium]
MSQTFASKTSTLYTFSVFQQNMLRLITEIRDSCPSNLRVSIKNPTLKFPQFSELRESMLQLHEELGDPKTTRYNLDSRIAQIWENLTPYRNTLDRLERFLNDLPDRNLKPIIARTWESLTIHKSTISELEDFLNDLYNNLEKKQQHNRP